MNQNDTVPPYIANGLGADCVHFDCKKQKPESPGQLTMANGNEVGYLHVWLVYLSLLGLGPPGLLAHIYVYICVYIHV